MDFQDIARTLREEVDKYHTQSEGLEYISDIWRLKRYLKQKFSGVDIEQLLGGKSQYNSEGRFYIIEENLNQRLVRLDPEQVRRRFYSTLSFLEGIREKTSRALNRKGYNTIGELISHPRFAQRAQKVWRILQETNVQELISLCYLRYPPSSSIFLFLSQLFNPQEFVFLDIESLGLFSGNMLFLVGIIKFDSQGAKLIQILARFPEEEPAVLSEVGRLLQDCRIMVSFNGKRFDYPYLQHRGAMYNLEFKNPLLHLDLLHFSRRMFNQYLNSFKLGDVEEKILNKTREEDIRSEYVPLLYREYLKEREPGYLYPLIIHNREDLLTLVELLNFLYTRCL